MCFFNGHDKEKNRQLTSLLVALGNRLEAFLVNKQGVVNIERDFKSPVQIN